MSEQHNHVECPTYQALKALEDKFHALDKQAAIDSASLGIQYGTIITLLTEGKEHTNNLSSRVSALEINSSVTDYKTERTVDFLDRLSWATVSKIVAILMAMGAVLLQFKK